MSTPYGTDFPDGWSVDVSRNGNHQLTANTNETHLGGGVTIYWTQRTYALGYGMPPDGDTPRFKGRNWRGNLVAAAVEALKQALTPFHTTTPTP